MPRKKAVPGYGPLPGSMPAPASHLMGGPSSMLPPSAFQLAPQPEPGLFAPQEMRFSSSSEATPVSTPAADVADRACKRKAVRLQKRQPCSLAGCTSLQWHVCMQLQC